MKIKLNNTWSYIPMFVVQWSPIIKLLLTGIHSSLGLRIKFWYDAQEYAELRVVKSLLTNGRG